ncbi:MULTISPECIES: DUF1836 domain-containing protein [Clostridium]|jgi:hypothetical protein|uniref:DUF1836 domain-containing protein n=2 Tax=Clostridium TaxID=1485 RepID=A0A151AQS7_9CLOT|nr:MULTISPECIES: DUF1836 domain-containing protein [Clostridium]KYH29991.1 hypothetical protein CLCOL_06290 [Clostridium colicanis DSM 13634]MBE6044197.1 DUF1836 domain-containing protein [Clostridium thermopalmarium]PRR75910.1 hypothetical protein CPAL_04010 [Clostridium thermopalmarium DSM 5974]PVZ24487.1 uncharacterized protein DUF1836 [Clostridium thermopalmarium DSM 5974]
MELDKKEINSLLEKIFLYENIRLSDIPDLDLYMDQVITLFNDKLSHSKRNDNDKILTKTMINNYTKAKILIPPNKKKYSKTHIILLILIYYLKQSLSISDIYLLFKDVIETLESDENAHLEIQKIYQSFLNIKKDQTDKIYESLSEKMDIIHNNTQELNSSNMKSEKMLITVLALINEANILKRLAEKIIDDFFANSDFK